MMGDVSGMALLPAGPFNLGVAVATGMGLPLLSLTGDTDYLFGDEDWCLFGIKFQWGPIQLPDHSGVDIPLVVGGLGGGRLRALLTGLRVVAVVVIGASTVGVTVILVGSVCGHRVSGGFVPSDSHGRAVAISGGGRIGVLVPFPGLLFQCLWLVLAPRRSQGA